MLCFFFKQKTAYEMRISDWSSDVCSSDLPDEAEVLSATAVAASPIAWASPATRLLPSPAVMTSLPAAPARVASLVCVAVAVAPLAFAPPETVSSPSPVAMTSLPAPAPLAQRKRGVGEKRGSVLVDAG